MTAARPPRRLASRARRIHSGFDGLQPRPGELCGSRRPLAAPDGATWLLAINAVSVGADRRPGPGGRVRRRGPARCGCRPTQPPDSRSNDCRGTSVASLRPAAARLGTPSRSDGAGVNYLRRRIGSAEASSVRRNADLQARTPGTRLNGRSYPRDRIHAMHVRDSTDYGRDPNSLRAARRRRPM
jgi:hypothetical protein